MGRADSIEKHRQSFRKENGMPRLRKAIASVAITALLITYCGCGGDDGGNISDRSAGGGRLVIGMQQEPEILNEAVNSMVAVVYVCNLLFSKFVKHDDSMRLVPDLITEVPTLENGGISADHLVYTYQTSTSRRGRGGTSSKA
jgi:peptide/nickel transport system substrate-binding protein